MPALFPFPKLFLFQNKEVLACRISNPSRGRLAPAGSKALPDLPLPTPFSIALGSFPVDTTLSVGSAHMTEGYSVSTANIIHHLSPKANNIWYCVNILS